jgi:hypothetical protein
LSTRIHLCGELRIELEGRAVDAALPGREARLLITHLIAHRSAAVERSELAPSSATRRMAPPSICAWPSCVRRSATAS